MRKIYGQSQNTTCIFCGTAATTKNWQKLPVCRAHVEEELEDIRCTCGEYLDVHESKWGAFFSCIKCGSMSLQKGLEMKELNTGKLNKKFREERKKTIPTIHDLVEQWEREEKGL